MNQASYSALSPVIRHFLPLSIPSDWAHSTAQRILEDRKAAFGLDGKDSRDFTGSFTSGSAMGNRVGIHTALLQHPDAFVSFSEATHYSVKKVMRDCDVLTNRWTKNQTTGGDEFKPRFAEIECDDLGHIRPECLAQRVKADRDYCHSCGVTHSVVLLLNIGTTFIGAWDDVLALRQTLWRIDCGAVYIHADGALDLASPANSKAVCLGPPHVLERNGIPVVQGITLSDHKAFGVIMVSGEVICYTPHHQHNHQHQQQSSPI